MRILILFAHPKFSSSVVHRSLLRAAAGLDNVMLHDLYAAYPSFAIDVGREQKLLLDHDLIVLQHPFYWYSCPAIVKEWLDLVLENGWAYGPGGTRLAGKFLMSAVSTGGSAEAYARTGRNRFEVGELLAPFDQTAHLCGMGWLEPFVVHAGRRMPPGDLATHADAYRGLISALASGSADPRALIARNYALPDTFHHRAA